MKASFIVAHFIPRDIARFSHASAAVVLLAASLDWDVIEKPNRATILRHEDVIIEVPDHQNLKFNVFRSWVRKLATHTPEFVLPMDVATKIVDITNLSPDHRRVIIDLAEQSVIPDATPDEVPEEPAATLLSREPYMAHLAGNTTYQSAASFERKWSDGHIDYECMVCGEGFATPKGVGGHRQMHIRKGEAEPNYRDQVRSAMRGKDPDWEVTPYGPRAGSDGDELPDLSDDTEPVVDPTPVIALAIADAPPADLLTETFEVLGRYVRQVLDENVRLKEQIVKMRSDMTAMFSLMQDITGDGS